MKWLFLAKKPAIGLHWHGYTIRQLIASCACALLFDQNKQR